MPVLHMKLTAMFQYFILTQVFFFKHTHRQVNPEIISYDSRVIFKVGVLANEPHHACFLILHCQQQQQNHHQCVWTLQPKNSSFSYGFFIRKYLHTEFLAKDCSFSNFGVLWASKATCEQAGDLLLMVSLLPFIMFLELISIYPYSLAVFKTASRA